MFKSAKAILSELQSSKYLIMRLATYETKSNYSMQYLGFLWEFVTPLLQIAVYWFVFGFGIRSGRPIDGVPFLPWLVAGIVVWFFIAAAITSTARSVYSKIGLVSKMSFPISTIPAYVLLSLFYRHAILVAVSYVLMWAFGYPMGLHSLWFIYLAISALALLYSLALITSALTTIVRDLQNLLQSLMRMLMYLTPIFWVPTGRLAEVLQINPLYYLIEGYRSMFLGTDWLANNWAYGLYYWAIVLVLFFVGSMIHMRFRRYFIDYI
ncbi:MULTISPECIES: ABC transporter permease [Exiguobacterium]|jgi:teichoic acid transport system permease protein|uniref:Transport permease protein n=1 Tax=Exiguobacterium chiriqhucha RW-2 TaxID=1345023 RepID=U1LZP8_9BACL|nr:MULTISPECIES: ABC transporter permease [Exiguobacterium]ERG67867.1 teichoic acid ABC transporter permease [Exiguobacterium chiriqhucha RW-2]KAB2862827.1 MAG: ABC transporter permease [Exiguobacterium chiriqhucha]TCI70201.1 ABC transporter permease [Exiguobacterium sp. IPCI3]TCI79232.1 ABC transporter permease [Exiguobacterium sp. IPCH1]TCI81708.1 ABC transporter permease [Exiguobacterium sp. IPBC4]